MVIGLSNHVFEQLKVEGLVGTVVLHHGENDLDVSFFEGVVDVGLAGAEHSNNSLVVFH